LIRPNSTPAAARDERAAVDRLLELLNLSSVADEEVSRLSLGAQRLVEVGRALAFRPTVILLDEPSSGLDSRETANLANTLQQTVTSEGVALVLVEHDVGFVLGLASDVYVLDSGALIAHGTGAQIRNDDAVVAAYLGSSGTRPK
jgi:branched-chain amino acid transport system ATP-binding protein